MRTWSYRNPIWLVHCTNPNENETQQFCSKTSVPVIKFMTFFFFFSWVFIKQSVLLMCQLQPCNKTSVFRWAIASAITWWVKLVKWEDSQLSLLCRWQWLPVSHNGAVQTGTLYFVWSYSADWTQHTYLTMSVTLTGWYCMAFFSSQEPWYCWFHWWSGLQSFVLHNSGLISWVLCAVIHYWREGCSRWQSWSF